MEKISDLQLEQFALGELSASETRRVQGELDRDQALRDRLSALHESDKAILRDYPPERIIPLITERSRTRQAQKGSRSRWVSGAAWALPAAAVLLLALSLGVLRPQTRLKGLTPTLSVFMQTAAGAQELSAGASAGQGDRLQLSYTAPGAKYAAIVSVDGRGTVTWHLPAGYAGGAGNAPAVTTTGRTVLPSSYELDDAPGFERFFLVYGTVLFNLADVQKAAQSLAARPAQAGTSPLALPRGLGQASFLVKKKGQS